MGATSTDFSPYMKSGLKLDSRYLDLENGIINFTTRIDLADDGTTELLTEENLPFLWVGPEKYWVSMLWDTPPTITARSYANVCTVNETPATGSLATQTGSTVNEYTYSYTIGAITTGGTSARYENVWDLSAGNFDNVLVLDADFGYGSHDEETGEGGQVTSGPLLYNKYNFYDLDGLLQNDAMDIDERGSIPLLCTLGDSLGVDSISIYTDDYTTTPSKTPAYYIRYHDNPPELSNLEVRATVDLLEESVNLYELTTENLNALTFTWGENDTGDMWYRMLMIDDVYIADKYHKVKMWIPLNESGATLDTVPSYTVHNLIAGTTTGATEGSTVRAVVEGQGGYAAQLDASTNGKVTVATADNTNLKDLTEFTLSLHWTPSSADLDTTSYIATATTDITDVTGNFSVFKNSDNKIQVKLGADIDMTGSTIIPCDASIPTSIIITLNTATASNIKAKLYVNGKLDDTSTSSTYVTTTCDFVVGGVYNASASYRGTTGLIEEVVLSTKAHEIVESSGEYIYNTVDKLDISGTKNITYNARLIGADYHNFRGSSPKGIGMTEPVSWRATTL